MRGAIDPRAISKLSLMTGGAFIGVHRFTSRIGSYPIEIGLSKRPNPMFARRYWVSTRSHDDRLRPAKKDPPQAGAMGKDLAMRDPRQFQIALKAGASAFALTLAL